MGGNRFEIGWGLLGPALSALKEVELDWAMLHRMEQAFVEDHEQQAVNFAHLSDYRDTKVQQDKIWQQAKEKEEDGSNHLAQVQFTQLEVDMRQEAVTGGVVQTLEQAFEAARHVRKGFQKLLEYLSENSGLKLKHATVKSIERAREKERDSYDTVQVNRKEKEGPACAWIFDLERASLFGNDAGSLSKGINCNI